MSGALSESACPTHKGGGLSLCTCHAQVSSVDQTRLKHCGFVCFLRRTLRKHLPYAYGGVVSHYVVDVHTSVFVDLAHYPKTLAPRIVRTDYACGATKLGRIFVMDACPAHTGDLYFTTLLARTSVTVGRARPKLASFRVLLGTLSENAYPAHTETRCITTWLTRIGPAIPTYVRRTHYWRLYNFLCRSFVPPGGL